MPIGSFYALYVVFFVCFFLKPITDFECVHFYTFQYILMAYSIFSVHTHTATEKHKHDVLKNAFSENWIRWFDAIVRLKA